MGGVFLSRRTGIGFYNTFLQKRKGYAWLFIMRMGISREITPPRTNGPTPVSLKANQHAVESEMITPKMRLSRLTGDKSLWGCLGKQENKNDNETLNRSRSRAM